MNNCWLMFLRHSFDFCWKRTVENVARADMAFWL